MDVAGYPAAGCVGNLERLAHQAFPFALARVQAPRHPPGQRDLHELQENQRAERDRGELGPDLVLPLRHRCIREVGLEQQLLAGRSAHGLVDLEQLAPATLEPVLGLGQIAHAGNGVAAFQGAAGVGGQRVGQSDQLRLVGVHDPPRCRPDLDPDQRPLRYVAHDRGFHLLQGGRLTGYQGVGQVGFDDRSGKNRGRSPRVADGLVPGRSLGDQGSQDRDDRQRHQPRERELHGCPAGVDRSAGVDRPAGQAGRRPCALPGRQPRAESGHVGRRRPHIRHVFTSQLSREV